MNNAIEERKIVKSPSAFPIVTNESYTFINEKGEKEVTEIKGSVYYSEAFDKDRHPYYVFLKDDYMGEEDGKTIAVIDAMTGENVMDKVELSFQLTEEDEYILFGVKPEMMGNTKEQYEAEAECLAEEYERKKKSEEAFWRMEAEDKKRRMKEYQASLTVASETNRNAAKETDQEETAKEETEASEAAVKKEAETDSSKEVTKS